MISLCFLLNAWLLITLICFWPSLFYFLSSVDFTVQVCFVFPCLHEQNYFYFFISIQYSQIILPNIAIIFISTLTIQILNKTWKLFYGLNSRYFFVTCVFTMFSNQNKNYIYSIWSKWLNIIKNVLYSYLFTQMLMLKRNINLSNSYMTDISVSIRVFRKPTNVRDLL